MCWQALASTIPYLQQNLWCMVGNGSAIELCSKFWTTPWDGARGAFLVYDIIDPDSKSWDWSRIQDIFPLTRLTRLDWRPGLLFLYQSEWFGILLSPASTLLWLGLLTSKRVPAGFKVNKVLLLYQTLRRHHLDIPDLYVFCNHEEDLVDHVFLHCPFSRVVSFGSPYCFRYDQIAFPSIRNWILHWCNRWHRNKVLFQDPWVATIHTISTLWLFRNKLVWAQSTVRPSPREVINYVNYLNFSSPSLLVDSLM